MRLARGWGETRSDVGCASKWGVERALPVTMVVPGCAVAGAAGLAAALLPGVPAAAGLSGCDDADGRDLDSLVVGTVAAGEAGGTGATDAELLGLAAAAAAPGAASAVGDRGGAEICCKRRSSAHCGTGPLPKLILRWPESKLVLAGSADEGACDWRSSDCGVRWSFPSTRWLSDRLAPERLDCPAFGLSRASVPFWKLSSRVFPFRWIPLPMPGEPTTLRLTLCASRWFCSDVTDVGVVSSSGSGNMR